MWFWTCQGKYRLGSVNNYWFCVLVSFELQFLLGEIVYQIRCGRKYFYLHWLKVTFVHFMGLTLISLKFIMLFPRNVAISKGILSLTSRNCLIKNARKNCIAHRISPITSLPSHSLYRVWYATASNLCIRCNQLGCKPLDKWEIINKTK